MFAFLATWWFWITVFIVVDLLICEATDSPIIGAASLVGAAFAYQFIADVNLFGYIYANPLNVVGFLVGYFAVGLCWFILKWFLYALDIRTKYRELKSEFYLTKKIPLGQPIPAKYNRSWHRAMDTAGVCGYRRTFPPKVREHKRRATRWVAYWPFSVVWSIFSDFIERIARAIYDFVSGFVQNLTDKMFAGEEVELEPENKTDSPSEDDDLWGTSVGS